MDNSTTAVRCPSVDTNKSTIFDGLTKPEETAIVAAIIVAGMAVCAIILRFTMPLMRRICRKCKGSPSALSGNKSTSDLLTSGPHCSPASSSSTLSRSSQLEVGKYEADDESCVTIVSSRTSDTAKNSVFGNIYSERLSLPLYLPKTRSDRIPRSSSARRLNQELTSVISTPTLQSLSYVTYPSESQTIPEVVEVHRFTPTGQDSQSDATPEQMTRF